MSVLQKYFLTQDSRPSARATALRLGWRYHIIHFNDFAATDCSSQIERVCGITVSRESVLYAQLEQLYKTPVASAQSAFNTRQEILTSCMPTSSLKSYKNARPLTRTNGADARIKFCASAAIRRDTVRGVPVWTILRPFCGEQTTTYTVSAHIALRAKWAAIPKPSAPVISDITLISETFKMG
jgi:hypothetical protein